MNTRTLTNQTILVTRSLNAGKHLCAAIENLSGQGIHFPTIAFAHPDDQCLLKQEIAILDQCTLAIFTSPQAVFASIPLINQAWPTLPSHLKLLAVGQGTAQAIQASGHACYAYPAQEWNSEGLLALPILKTIQEQKIAILGGLDGRTQLQETLHARGAKVSKIVCYKRVLPQADTRSIAEKLKNGEIDVVVCTSFDAVKHLQILFKSLGEILCKTPLLVISERIKMLAEGLGFQTIWVAQNASSDAIITTLLGIHYDR